MVSHSHESATVLLLIHNFAADTLDRCEVPFFGRLASSILDDE
jgi:hypothetical protein